jgi:hypothetical protein
VEPGLGCCSVDRSTGGGRAVEGLSLHAKQGHSSMRTRCVALRAQETIAVGRSIALKDADAAEFASRPLLCAGGSHSARRQDRPW